MSKKCVVIGVTGGIAAYKVCTLVSSLRKQDYDVHVLMTEAATKLVGPATFEALSNNPVILDMFSQAEGEVPHIALAKKADLFVIAPASANTIAKIAHGFADSMLTTTFLAATCPKLIVPAMNTHMLENVATQDNLATLVSRGMHVMGSGEGFLACGDVGKGRLPEPDEIEDVIKELLVTDKFLAGKNVLITAGPTQEAIDPVRYISNHSSGKMGFALAKAARNAGANVTLVAGINHLPPVRGVTTIPVVSAEDMKKAVLPLQKKMDIMILSAAVADYRPKEVASQKIKKGTGMVIDLERTTDILATLGEKKKKGQLLIGFAMETQDLIASAKGKLKKKNCDYIVANNLFDKGAGFQVDTNHVTIIGEKEEMDLGLLSKDETAEKILTYCVKGVK